MTPARGPQTVFNHYHRMAFLCLQSFGRLCFVLHRQTFEASAKGKDWRKLRVIQVHLIKQDFCRAEPSKKRRAWTLTACSTRASSTSSFCTTRMAMLQKLIAATVSGPFHSMERLFVPCASLPRCANKHEINHSSSGAVEAPDEE